MKSRSILKNQFFYYENASNFHNKVRDIFANDSFFKQFACYQEVPLSFLVNGYPNNKDAVDWWIDEFGVIIELHGKQHYQATSWSKEISYAEKQKAFNNIKFRDNRKKTALELSGYKYIEICYKDKKKLNAEFLKNLIFA